MTGHRGRTRQRAGAAGRTVTLGRLARAAVAVLVAAPLAGCYSAADAEVNPPGRNLRVNDIAIRYAHLDDPDTPGTGYRPGDDVPLYLWLVNESGEPAALAGVSSSIAQDVTLTEGDLPVDLPVGELVDLGPDNAHFVLREITTQVRGAQFVPISLTFADGSEVEFEVEAIEAGPPDSAAPGA